MSIADKLMGLKCTRLDQGVIQFPGTGHIEGHLEQILLTAVVVLALILAFVNGFHDGFNVIANSVLSRSMTPAKALIITCGAAVIGPLLFGTAVATTIGSKIFDPACLELADGRCTTMFLLAGLLSAIIWSLLTWWVGMPPSSSHALIGGLVGGAMAAQGWRIVAWHTLLAKVILILFLSPLIGIIVAHLAMTLAVYLFKDARARMNDFFKRYQWVSLIILGAAHGSNNAQKAMGVIAMILVASGSLRAFEVPLWVVLTCTVTLALGVSSGGWKIAGVFGNRRFRIEPVHAFNAQLTAGAVILAAAISGGPISTTQIIKTNIVGVGVGYRKGPVRRMLLKEFMIAWLFTVPASAFLSATIYWSASGALGYGMGSFDHIMAVLGL